MSSKAGPRPDEGLMMMQELDDRLKEQIDKLEHVRLAAVELKDNLSGVGGSVGVPQDIPFIDETQFPVGALCFYAHSCFSITEQWRSEPVHCGPPGLVEPLVRASGERSYEHNGVCAGDKHSLIRF